MFRKDGDGADLKDRLVKKLRCSHGAVKIFVPFYGHAHWRRIVFFCAVYCFFAKTKMTRIPKPLNTVRHNINNNYLSPQSFMRVNQIHFPKGAFVILAASVIKSDLNHCTAGSLVLLSCQITLGILLGFDFGIGNARISPNASKR